MMDFDPELLQQLIDTFKIELEEKLQVIIDSLLALEKNNLPAVECAKTIESVFRAAHNIKGAAYGIGINDVGQISHHIESLFSLIQKNTLELTPIIITLCLESVDKMRTAMQAFIDKTPLNFDLEAFLLKLGTHTPTANIEPISKKPG